MASRARIARGMVLVTTGALVSLAGASGGCAWAAEGPDTAPPSAVRASALMDWQIAASLGGLRAEVNAAWPARDRSSDGAVGDTRHQSRTNSHNPVGHGGGPAVGTRGAVHALDITARGIDVDRVLQAVIGDSRVWYVIYGGQIWSRTTGWAPRAYDGDPHTTHIHVNLREDSQAAAVLAEIDTRPWLARAAGTGRGTSVQVGRSTPTGAPALSMTLTRALQKALIAGGYPIPAGATGTYGPQTTAAVRSFQEDQGWSGAQADGIAGPETLRRLGVTAEGATDLPNVDSRSRATSTTPARSAAATSATAAPTGKAPTSAYVPGTASRAVYALQQALIAAGHPIPAGATGYYGTRTVEAVKAFQRAQGWREDQCDGIPGPRTLALLGL